jgi:phosphoadenosine phosphosulfate reductase
MREHAPYNTLYEQGFDRIGCFMCPASDMALIHRIESDYPVLWKGWMEHLTRWQEMHGLPGNWASSGKWRIREGSGNEDDRNC